ncbi:MAG: hypothetical protein K0Q72_703 [Armatimonadetes bacterium]|jgi:hypothetical protein|nr:hypothetical protein [Armatimonadota bacterium]
MPPPPPTEAEQPLIPPVLERWLLALTRIAINFLAAAILMRLPLPIVADWLAIKDVVIAVVAVILSGKCLFDTFFYDHFHP